MIVIDRVAMVNAVRAVAEVWKNSDNNNLQHGLVRIKNEDGDLTLSSWSSLIHVKRTKVAELDKTKSLDVLVMGQVLKNFLELQKTDVNLKVNKNKIVLKCGSAVLNLNTYDDSESSTPKLPTIKSDPDIIIQSEILQQASRFVTRTVKNILAGRDLIRSVKMSVQGNELHIASTDGPHLAVAKQPIGEKKEFDAVLETELFDSMSKVHESDVQFYDLDHRVMSVSDNAICMIPKMATGFLPYVQLLNNAKCDTQLDIDRKVLLHAVKTISVVSGQTCNTDLMLDKEEMILRTHPGTEEEMMGRSSHTIEVSHDFDSRSMMVKTKDLVEALESSAGDSILLMIENNGKFLMFKDTRRWLQVFSSVAF